MEILTEKRERLKTLLAHYTKTDCAVAFSGGVDSSLLLKLACEAAEKNHTKVYAFTIHTVLHPQAETELARKLAAEMGAEHCVVSVNELAAAGIERNPKDRCYRCKKCMFEKVISEARKRGAEVILEGTNADDTGEYRPGIRALRELGVISPLMLAGFSKEEVRQLATEYHLSVSDKPSSPCMATRFPYDTKLEEKELRNVERMEEEIHALGFYNVRTRIHDRLVRVEVDANTLQKAVEQRENLIQIAKAHGYDYVTLDLEGFRSGSQDVRINSLIT